GEMRQVDHADVVAHRQLLGIRDGPEVACIPFIASRRYTVTVRLQQALVGTIAMGALPAGGLHEVAAQLLLAWPERTAAQIATGDIRLTRVHGRVVDFLRRLEAAAEDVARCLLHRIEAGDVDAARVPFGAARGHPVGQHLGDSWRILDPHGLREPESADLWRLADER